MRSPTGRRVAAFEPPSAWPRQVQHLSRESRPAIDASPLPSCTGGEGHLATPRAQKADAPTVPDPAAPFPDTWTTWPNDGRDHGDCFQGVPQISAVTSGLAIGFSVRTRSAGWMVALISAPIREPARCQRRRRAVCHDCRGLARSGLAGTRASAVTHLGRGALHQRRCRAVALQCLLTRASRRVDRLPWLDAMVARGRA